MSYIKGPKPLGTGGDFPVGLPGGMLPGPIPGPGAPGIPPLTPPAGVTPSLFPTNVKWGDIVNVIGPFAGKFQGQVLVRFEGAPAMAPALTSAYGGSVVVPDGARTGACTVELDGRTIFSTNCVVTGTTELSRPREPRGTKAWRNVGTGSQLLGSPYVLGAAVSGSVLTAPKTKKKISFRIKPLLATSTEIATKKPTFKSPLVKPPLAVTQPEIVKEPAPPKIVVKPPLSLTQPEIVLVPPFPAPTQPVVVKPVPEPLTPLVPGVPVVVKPPQYGGGGGVLPTGTKQQPLSVGPSPQFEEIEVPLTIESSSKINPWLLGALGLAAFLLLRKQ